MENTSEITELKAENEQLKQLNQWLLDQLKLARKRQFGASSEKFKLDGGEQLGLFNEEDWNVKGILLSRQTMSNWLIRATNDWLQPIFDVMKAELRRRQVLHADETKL